MERPFTGDLWEITDQGHYECAICNHKLFTHENKFQPPTGMASFWDCSKGSVEIIDENTKINSKMQRNFN